MSCRRPHLVYAPRGDVHDAEGVHEAAVGGVADPVGAVPDREGQLEQRLQHVCEGTLVVKVRR